MFPKRVWLYLVGVCCWGGSCSTLVQTLWPVWFLFLTRSMSNLLNRSHYWSTPTTNSLITLPNLSTLSTIPEEDHQYSPTPLFLKTRVVWLLTLVWHGANGISTHVQNIFAGIFIFYQYYGHFPSHRFELIALGEMKMICPKNNHPSQPLVSLDTITATTLHQRVQAFLPKLSPPPSWIVVPAKLHHQVPCGCFLIAEQTRLLIDNLLL